MSDNAQLGVLSRALDQAGELLAGVDDDQYDASTPCHDWKVRELVDHLAAGPAKFAQQLRGEKVDWSGGEPTDDPAGTFRSGAEELQAAWEGQEDTSMADFQSAELGLHTWDLATALGKDTAELDPEVAERGLAMMQRSLNDDNRGEAFGPEQPAPEGAGPYERLAAFAGRTV